MCNTRQLKLKGVVGYNGRRNDVIYSPPLEKSDLTNAVVYFGGDIQVIIHISPISVYFCSKGVRSEGSGSHTDTNKFSYRGT